MMLTTPYRLVTLLELLEHNAEAFCRLSSVIGQAIVLLKTSKIPDLDALVGSLGELNRETERLGLPSATKQLKRIYASITTAGTDVASIGPMVIDLYNRLRDDLEERAFVSIPAELTRLYRQDDPPFGRPVSDAFPHSIEDISEAAKCLALGRSTATVFHLMRAMEGAVQRLAAKLGVKNVDKEWGKLISDIAQAIEAMPKGSDRNRWSETKTHLYHVKQAWRNDTMHPKQTYTFEEARAIFEAVKVFMNGLAALV